jgi:hypothetical protein
MIVAGIKTVIKDKKTDKYGISTYGLITNISETGSYVNNNPELRADILTYLPYEGTTKTFKEIIGFAPPKYDIGTYVLLNQHEDDVNIVQSTDKNFIPRDILEKLSEHIIDSAPKTIVIGDYKYIREDLVSTFDLINDKNKTDIY